MARPLSPAGAEAIRELGAQLASRGWKPTAVFTSPLERARETGRVLLGAAGIPIAVENLRELAPDREPKEVGAALVAVLKPMSHVLLVGHQPLLGELVAYWTGTPVAFAPGEFVGLEFDVNPAARAGRVTERIAPR